MRLIASVSAAAVAAFVAVGPAAAQNPISVDQERTITGRLESGDAVVPGEAIEGEGRVLYDDYQVRLSDHQRVRITVRAEDLDPVVSVYRAGALEEPLAENDDDGESLNSRLTFAAPQAGVYVLRVRSFGGDSYGAYTLTASPLPPLPEPASISRGGSRTRTLWRTFDGSLGGDDAEADGVYFDDYRVSLRAGEELLLRVDSQAFDPVVQILTASDREGQAIEGDDDSGPGVNALLGFAPDAAGDYIVRVTSFGSGTGRYRLRVGR